MCTERAASTCPSLECASVAQAAGANRSWQGAAVAHDPPPQAGQHGLQGLAWQLAAALGARAVDQQLADALKQAVPAALGIRLCLRVGGRHLATSSNLLKAGELGVALTAVSDKCLASRCAVLGALQLADAHKQNTPCGGACRRSLFVPVALPPAVGRAPVGCLIMEYVCADHDAMRRCSPEVYGLAHALSQPLLEATAGLRTQLAAAAVVASQPQSPLLRAAMLSSIPEGGLPLDDPDEDAISESPSLAERLALLAELTDEETDSEADVPCGGGAGRRRIGSSSRSDEGARPSCREDPGGSWRDDKEDSAPALPVASPPNGGVSEGDAAPSQLLPPPAQLPARAAPWPPHGSELWRSSFQSERRAAASDDAEVVPPRGGAAAAQDAAGTKQAPPQVPRDATHSTANGGAGTDPETDGKARQNSAPAAVGPAATPPTAAAAAMHPLWLTFANPALEQAFAAWQAQHSHLWDVMQLTMLLVNIAAKSAPHWRVLPPIWYPSIAVKACALFAVLAQPDRWARRREAALLAVMAVSCACLAGMATPRHMRLTAARHDATLAARSLALPNLAAYTSTVWVRFSVLLPVAVACWAAAATLVPQYCADSTVGWLPASSGWCVAAAVTLQAVGGVAMPLAVRRWCEGRARRRFLLQLRTRS